MPAGSLWNEWVVFAFGSWLQPEHSLLCLTDARPECLGIGKILGVVSTFQVAQLPDCFPIETARRFGFVRTTALVSGLARLIGLFALGIFHRHRLLMRYASVASHVQFFANGFLSEAFHVLSALGTLEVFLETLADCLFETLGHAVYGLSAFQVHLAAVYQPLHVRMDFSEPACDQCFNPLLLLVLFCDSVRDVISGRFNLSLGRANRQLGDCHPH